MGCWSARDGRPRGIEETRRDLDEERVEGIEVETLIETRRMYPFD